jgi:hypothetical protein
MKSSAFPMRLELHCKTDEGEWKLMVTYYVTNHNSLYKKMESIRTYVLNREYKIYLLVNSKVNSHLE